MKIATPPLAADTVVRHTDTEAVPPPRVSYQRERAHELWAEIPTLLHAHYTELATYHDIPLDPDVEAYCRLDDQDLLRCYTARRGSELIGYAVFLVGPNLHYRGSKQARADVVYVIPEHRHTRVGFRLLTFADMQLREEHTQVTCHHVKHTHPDLGHLLTAIGYQPIETLYARRLDRWA